MAKEITTEILIHAEPTIIWSVLTKFDNYPNWNPFINQSMGRWKLEKKLPLELNPQEQKE